MDFDFHALYTTYSTRELLKIVAALEQYQPGAVQTALDILAGRHPDEIAAAESELQQGVVKPAKQQPEVLQPESIFDDIAPPENETLTRRFRLIIIAATGVMVGYALYKDFRIIWYLPDPTAFFRDANSLLSIAVELTGATAVVRSVQQTKAGWILNMAYITFNLLAFLLIIALNIYYRTFYRFPYLMLIITLYTGIAYLLWLLGIKKDVWHRPADINTHCDYLCRCNGKLLFVFAVDEDEQLIQCLSSSAASRRSFFTAKIHCHKIFGAA